MQAWLNMTAADLGRGIDAGEVDAVALTEAYLEAAAGHELTPRIYARLTPERARAEAAAAAERANSGRRRSLLDGVPISWKDLFDTAGIATEGGSRLLAGRTPVRDATLVARASTAGLVCLGKTHMTELAFSGLGLNPMTASPPSVTDLDAVSGGSSSGAATSVAFGLAACGIGSDTGGSIRVPAAWNNLVGFKPGHGGLPMAGVLPLCARFDSAGPLARSVEDAALMHAVFAGERAPDLAGASLDGVRLAVVETVAMEGVRPEPAAGFDAAVTRLEAAGATVARFACPDVAAAHALSPILFATEAYGTWRDAIEADPDLMYGPVRDRFRGGRDHSGADFVAAWQALDRYRIAYAEATAGFDAVILPTAPNLPPNMARLEADGAYFVEENLLTLRNTRIGNLMGLAAVTLPTEVPAVGLMLMGPAGAEARLLRLAAAAETALAAEHGTTRAT